MTDTDGYYVLDAEDRLMRAAGVMEHLERFLGHPLWESSPHAEPIFRPHFDEARRTGHEVQFTAYYAGRVAHRRVVPASQALTVYVTPLQELNVRTLGTLAASLERIEAELAGRASEQLDPPAPASLQALS